MDRRGDLCPPPVSTRPVGSPVRMNKEVGKQIQSSTPVLDCVTHYRSAHTTIMIIISQYE